MQYPIRKRAHKVQCSIIDTKIGKNLLARLLLLRKRKWNKNFYLSSSYNDKSTHQHISINPIIIWSSHCCVPHNCCWLCQKNLHSICHLHFGKGYHTACWREIIFPLLFLMWLSSLSKKLKYCQLIFLSSPSCLLSSCFIFLAGSPSLSHDAVLPVWRTSQSSFLLLLWSHAAMIPETFLVASSFSWTELFLDAFFFIFRMFLFEPIWGDF